MSFLFNLNLVFVRFGMIYYELILGIIAKLWIGNYVTLRYLLLLITNIYYAVIVGVTVPVITHLLLM
jgi:hypothetical protein